MADVVDSRLEPVDSSSDNLDEALAMGLDLAVQTICCGVIVDSTRR